MSARWANRRGDGRLSEVPFARLLISFKKSRTAVAAAGIGFAILVIFVQLGFYSAVTNTALAVSSRLNGELLLVSPRFVHLSDAGTIPRTRLFQLMAHPAVEAATPVHFRYIVSRDSTTGIYCRLFVLGFPLAEARLAQPLKIPEVNAQLDLLKSTGNVLMDRFTQERCGPSTAEGSFELMGKAARVVGHFELGVGFLGAGAVVASDDSLVRFFKRYSTDRPHLGVVKLKAGADPAEVAASLRAMLPSDVRIITREELDAIQLEHWVENTAVGNIFGMGAIAGFLVGVVVLYQILSTDIRNHLPLYATLRAMGYTSRRLHGYVLEQAWLFAGLGYAPALLITLILFPIVHDLTRLPIFVTLRLAAGVLILSFVMCSLSAILSSYRLRRADPAELF